MLKVNTCHPPPAPRCIWSCDRKWGGSSWSLQRAARVAASGREVSEGTKSGWTRLFSRWLSSSARSPGAHAFDQLMATASHPPQRRPDGPSCLRVPAAAAAAATHAPCGEEAELQEGGVLIPLPGSFQRLAGARISHMSNAANRHAITRFTEGAGELAARQRACFIGCYGDDGRKAAGCRI